MGRRDPWKNGTQMRSERARPKMFGEPRSERDADPGCDHRGPEREASFEAVAAAENKFRRVSQQVAVEVPRCFFPSPNCDLSPTGFPRHASLAPSLPLPAKYPSPGFSSSSRRSCIILTLHLPCFWSSDQLLLYLNPISR